MKVKLIKNWYFCPIYSEKKSCYKKGLIIKGERVTRNGVGSNSDVKIGDLHIPHFYCYNQGEVIPQRYFKKI